MHLSDKLWEAFQLAESIELAQKTLSYFVNGSFAIHPELGFNIILPMHTSPGVTSIRGVLNLSHHTTQTKATAECTFFFPAGWRYAPPHLRCTEKWIRTSSSHGKVDWHIYPDNTLCYVIAPQWTDQIKAVETRYGTRSAIHAAAFHAINNARWLLYHHLLGYRQRLTDWPKDWPQWSHRNGFTEYARTRSAGIAFSNQ